MQPLPNAPYQQLSIQPKLYVLGILYESVVSLVARCYTRAGIGNERLVVCLSEYLP